MSYLAEIHSGGGSMGEAMDAIAVAHVETEEELAELKKYVYAKAKPYHEVYVTEIEMFPVQSLEDAKKSMDKAYIFEEDEDEEWERLFGLWAKEKGIPNLLVGDLEAQFDAARAAGWEPGELE